VIAGTSIMAVVHPTAAAPRQKIGQRAADKGQQRAPRKCALCSHVECAGNRSRNCCMNLCTNCKQPDCLGKFAVDACNKSSSDSAENGVDWISASL
jgi:hypothetical protein